jgi:DNA-binding NtrC family response regulator
MARVLLIDDDAAGRQLAAFNLKKAGYQVDQAESAEQGLERFDAARHELVITDVRMPGLSGITLLERLRGSGASTPVLVITAYGDVETAVAAMKAGAFEFLLKPFSRDQLLVVVERALEHERLKRENSELRRQLAGVERPIVFGSAAMAQTVELADRAAASDATC